MVGYNFVARHVRRARRASSNKSQRCVRQLLIRAWRAFSAAVVLAGALGLSNSAYSAQEPITVRGNQKFDLATNIKPGFTLAAVGDLIMPQPISMVPSFVPVGDLIKSSDVAFGNFEGNIADLRNMASWVEAETGGGALPFNSAVASDLKKIGFDLMARANNHALDLGVEGMKLTTRVLEDAGLVQAGVGMSQAGAGAAAYLNTPSGRVALISVASSFTPMSRSGPAVPRILPRPGVNALRTTAYHLVTPEEMHALEKLREKQPAGSVRPYEHAQKQHGAESDALTLFGVHYLVGGNHGSHYTMNQIDLQRILLDVENAKKSSDFVIVSIHAHEPGNWSEAPADFESEFAHDVIDAGADVVLGQGPHQLRGIEIYEGRPVFYSFGNFIFQADITQPVEPDLYESFKFDPRKVSPVDLNTYYTRVGFANPNFYQSFVATMTFGKHGVTKIKLHPVDLDITGRPADRGIPALAKPAMAHKILTRLQRLSKPFGTQIDVEGNVGVIRP